MIGPPEQTWMIGFRVDDLDAMAEQLRRAGESVDIDPSATRMAASLRSATPRAIASNSGSPWLPPSAAPLTYQTLISSWSASGRFRACGPHSTIAVVLSIAGAVLTPPRRSARSASSTSVKRRGQEMAVKLLARNATLQRSLTEGRVSAQEVLPFFAGNRQVDEALARARKMSAADPAELHEIETPERAGWVGGPRRRRSRARGQGAPRAAPTPLLATRRSRPPRRQSPDSADARSQPWGGAEGGGAGPGEVDPAAEQPCSAWSASGSPTAPVCDAARGAPQPKRRPPNRPRTRARSTFAEGMQVAQDQQEGHELLRSHLKRWVPTPLCASSCATTAPIGWSPRSRCPKRIRLRRRSPRPSPLMPRRPPQPPRGPGRESDEVLTCESAASPRDSSMCQPLLVGGEVIGSVLVTEQRGISEGETRRIHDSVTQAAPVLANLRNLSLAERRASTDSLTGLPNRRGSTTRSSGWSPTPAARTPPCRWSPSTSTTSRPSTTPTGTSAATRCWPRSA